MTRDLRYLVILVAGLVSAAALAGCATPEESGDDGLDTDPGQGGDLGDEGDNGLGDGNMTGGGNTTGNGTWATGDTILIDGNPYECDDTLNADGVCDEWDYQELADETAGAQEFSFNEDGTVTIGGHTYECDDTNTVDFPAGAPEGACVTYQLVE